MLTAPVAAEAGWAQRAGLAGGIFGVAGGLGFGGGVAAASEGCGSVVAAEAVAVERGAAAGGLVVEDVAAVRRHEVSGKRKGPPGWVVLFLNFTLYIQNTKLGIQLRQICWGDWWDKGFGMSGGYFGGEVWGLTRKQRVAGSGSAVRVPRCADVLPPQRAEDAAGEELVCLRRDAGDDPGG